MSRVKKEKTKTQKRLLEAVRLYEEGRKKERVKTVVWPYLDFFARPTELKCGRKVSGSEREWEIKRAVMARVAKRLLRGANRFAMDNLRREQRDFAILATGYSMGVPEVIKPSVELRKMVEAGQFSILGI